MKLCLNYSYLKFDFFSNDLSGEMTDKKLIDLKRLQNFVSKQTYYIKTLSCLKFNLKRPQMKK